MTIAREEIFGPVLSILPYDNEDEAIAIANDTVYGLSGYVQSGDLERARGVAAPCAPATCTSTGAGLDSRRAVRRLQAVGQRPRMGRVRVRGVPRGQIDVRLSGGMIVMGSGPA